MVLACYIMSQDHVIRGLCDFKVSYHPPKFGGHGHSGSGVITNLVGHVILKDHVVM